MKSPFTARSPVASMQLSTPLKRNRRETATLREISEITISLLTFGWALMTMSRRANLDHNLKPFRVTRGANAHVFKLPR